MRTLFEFAIAVTVILCFCRLGGLAVKQLRQPEVIGELTFGIAIGPLVIGALSPGFDRAIFPREIMGPLNVAATVGLSLYILLAVMQLELKLPAPRSKGTRLGFAVVIAAALGALIAAAVCFRYAPHDVSFLTLTLFLAGIFAVSAVPVMARIADDHRPRDPQLIRVALSAALVGDFAAWTMITIGGAINSRRSVDAAAVRIFAVVALLIATHRMLVRSFSWLEQRSQEPRNAATAALLVIVVGVGAAYTSSMLGLTAVVGAVLVGTVATRQPRLLDTSRRLLRRIQPALYLPLTFAYCGLHATRAAFDGTTGARLMFALVAVPVLMRVCAVAAFQWRGRVGELISLTSLLGARGVTELVILNLALSVRAITPAMFTILVVMTLTTTALASPLLRLSEYLEARRALPIPASREAERWA